MRAILSIKLRAYTTSDNSPIEVDHFESPHQQCLIQAIDSQDEIGWDGMFQGYISSLWAKAHILYMKETSTYTPTNLLIWKCEFMNCLMGITEKMWAIRNEYLHGKEKQVGIKEERKILKTRIRQLYRESRELILQEDKKVFSLPLYKRLRQSIDQMFSWIELADLTLRLHRERATKNTIIQYLVDRTGSPR